MKSVAGRTAVVTGAASGIGTGMARAFAEAGMNTVLADVDTAGAEKVAEELRGQGRRAVAVATDVANWEAVQHLADVTYDTFGSADVLCNNAGVFLAGPVATMRVDDWRWVFSVNVFGVIHGVHAFLPRMTAQAGGGHIVNTASVAGFGSGAGFGAIYSAAKGVVVSISEALREELAPAGIGVTALCPAAVNTRILAAQRNRPSRYGRPAPEPLGADPISVGLEPIEVGRMVLRAVLADEPWVFTHPDVLQSAAGPRFARILGAIEAARDGPSRG
jgi:NAD(P)-dependent dehydrogenase (short-subunit alcohol dehydrogenase family)